MLPVVLLYNLIFYFLFFVCCINCPTVVFFFYLIIIFVVLVVLLQDRLLFCYASCPVVTSFDIPAVSFVLMWYFSVMCTVSVIQL